MRPGASADTTVPALSTQQLLYLRAAARAASWTEAAAQLGVTQSALSQGIAELERRLGITLFERLGRRRVLTSAGAVLLPHADGVVAQAADLGRIANRLRSGARGAYRLGLIDSAAVATCRPALAAVRELAGDALHVTVDTSVPLTRAVQRGELDLAVVVGDNIALRTGGRGGPSESTVTTTTIADEPMVVVAPGGVSAGRESQCRPRAAISPTTPMLANAKPQAFAACRPPVASSTVPNSTGPTNDPTDPTMV